MAGCTYVGRHKTLLRHHVKGHRIYTGFREFPVPRCKFWARSPNSFKQHEIFHNKGREFACALCPKFFGNKQLFWTHIFSHTKEKTPQMCVLQLWQSWKEFSNGLSQSTSQGRKVQFGMAQTHSDVLILRFPWKWRSRFKANGYAAFHSDC